jgi:hypothetical protein
MTSAPRIDVTPPAEAGPARSHRRSRRVSSIGGRRLSRRSFEAEGHPEEDRAKEQESDQQDGNERRIEEARHEETDGGEADDRERCDTPTRHASPVGRVLAIVSGVARSHRNLLVPGQDELPT